LVIPKSLVLVHGAGSTPQVYDGWYRWFPGLVVHAVELRAGLEVARARMADYAAAVIRAANPLPKPLALCGWSMGGLVALQAGRALVDDLYSLILIEPSPPAEIQGYNLDVVPEPGTFNPEAVYGPFPPGQPACPESTLARLERKRGISVPAVPCPALVISGKEFPEERGSAIARLYGAEERVFPDLDHWGLVLDPRVPGEVARFLGAL
jgi:pimeloyl-ACP methyl ester carboxylesterase